MVVKFGTLKLVHKFGIYIRIFDWMHNNALAFLQGKPITNALVLTYNVTLAKPLILFTC